MADDARLDSGAHETLGYDVPPYLRRLPHASPVPVPPKEPGALCETWRSSEVTGTRS